MAHEDDLIKGQIQRLEAYGFDSHIQSGMADVLTIADVLTELLKKINKLEQEVKELRYGGKKLK